jgi:hypothetical protein
MRDEKLETGEKKSCLKRLPVFSHSSVVHAMIAVLQQRCCVVEVKEET